MTDAQFFEELSAHDADLLLAHARGEVQGPLRERLQASLAASPSRRQRFEEMQALVTAASMLRDEAEVRRRAPESIRPRHRWRLYMLLSAAAVLVVATAGTWV